MTNTTDQQSVRKAWLRRTRTAFLLPALLMLPLPMAITGYPLAAEELPAAADSEVKPEGFPPPEKGPLISELREKMAEAPGGETIIRLYEDAAGGQIREFFINGHLFQIQVLPPHAPPYYLIDTEGDGIFRSRFNGIAPRLLVPQWVLFRF